jgi:hypothetical protein
MQLNAMSQEKLDESTPWSAMSSGSASRNCVNTISPAMLSSTNTT